MPHDAAPLPEIPLIDVGEGGPLALLAAEHARAAAILTAGRRRYGRLALTLGDHLSWQWLERTGNPYRDEIAAVARSIGETGAAMLNLSFEWSCTTGTAPDAAGPGRRFVRVLDWPFDGLGRHVVVARMASPAGPWLNVTWPGAVGVLTALAPGRFAAAINQAPMVRRGFGLVGDWAANRVRLWRRGGLPPAHLLRQVFEQAPDFAAAKRMLTETPLALPALFVLGGSGPSEGALIERMEDRAMVHDGTVACANAWSQAGWGGRPRGHENSERRQAMIARLTAAEPERDFAWLRPPVLNPKTRVAVSADPVGGALRVQGYEAGRPATAVLAVPGP